MLSIFGPIVVPIVLMLLALLSAVMSIVGCCGAIRESKCKLWTVCMPFGTERRSEGHKQMNFDEPLVRDSVVDYNAD